MPEREDDPGWLHKSHLNFSVLLLQKTPLGGPHVVFLKYGTSPGDFGPEPKRLDPVQELKVTAPVRGWHTPWALKTLPEKPGVALGPKNGARETGTGHGA